MDVLAELLSMEGRANRWWYFWHIVLDDLVVGAMVILMIVIGVVVGTTVHWIVAALLALPMLGILIGGVWAAVAVTVKRLHDLDRPGWQILLLAIPLFNIFFGLYLIFARGTFGPNRYGPDPLQAAEASGYVEGASL